MWECPNCRSVVEEDAITCPGCHYPRAALEQPPEEPVHGEPAPALMPDSYRTIANRVFDASAERRTRLMRNSFTFGFLLIFIPGLCLLVTAREISLGYFLGILVFAIFVGGVTALFWGSAGILIESIRARFTKVPEETVRAIERFGEEPEPEPRKRKRNKGSTKMRPARGWSRPASDDDSPQTDTGIQPGGTG